MWYFAWILGTGLAVSFAIVNALWHEINCEQKEHQCINRCGGHH